MAAQKVYLHVYLQSSFLSRNPPAPPEALSALVQLINTLIQGSYNFSLDPKCRSQKIPLRTWLFLGLYFLQKDKVNVVNKTLNNKP